MASAPTVDASSVASRDFPIPGGSEHGEESATLFLDRALERVHEHPKLLAAADERQVESAEDGRRRSVDIVDAPPPDLLALALYRNPLQRAGGNRVLDQRIRRPADDDLTGPRALLEPLGDDDRLAGDESEPVLGVPCQDLAGIDADPRLEPEFR